MFCTRRNKLKKSTNHHSMSHLIMVTMIHRWCCTVVMHWRHCRHFHMSAMAATVTHFAFNSTESSIKITRSVNELKLWNHEVSSNKREQRNSFQPERMSVPVLSRKSRVWLFAWLFCLSDLLPIWGRVPVPLRLWGATRVWGFFADKISNVNTSMFC